MSNFSLILKNCNLVNEDSIVPVDIGIKGDRIEKIASQISSESNKTIDLEGKYVAPGIIDDQLKKGTFVQNHWQLSFQVLPLPLICQMSIPIQLLLIY